jgi:hypothetical protein
MITTGTPEALTGQCNMTSQFIGIDGATDEVGLAPPGNEGVIWVAPQSPSA